MTIPPHITSTTFSLITDAHLGKDNKSGTGGTFGTRAKDTLRRYVHEMNTRLKPDFVVSLGDNINDVNRSQDAKNMRTYQRYLGKLKTSSYHAIGNHDVKNLTCKSIKSLLETKRFYFAFEAGHILFVILYSFPGSKPTLHKPVIIRNKQLQWLKTTLRNSYKPVIIFNHYPLDEQDLRKNPYAKFFLRHPLRASVKNRRTVRQILEASKKVLAVFTGHLHWKKKHVIHKIPYYSTPSLTEAGHRGWTEVTIRGKKVSVKNRRVPT